MNLKTKDIINYAVYLAIFAIMGVIPQFGITSAWGIQFTLFVVPVVICTLHIGPKGALFSSCLFGIFSFISALVNPILLVGLEAYSLGQIFLLCFVPRAMMGLVLAAVLFIWRKTKPFNVIKSKVKSQKLLLLVELGVFSVLTLLLNTFLFAMWLVLLGFDTTAFWIIVGAAGISLPLEYFLNISICLSLTPLLVFLQKRLNLNTY